MNLNPFKAFQARKKRNRWDAQYADGFWDKILKSPLEQDRYEGVRSFIAAYSDKGKILEVGAGDGLLQETIKEDSYSKYIGIDLSKVAIDKAAHLQSDKTEYLCADMETFVPSGRFEVIVFNESLYYSSRPLALTMKYRKYLSAKGVLIISMVELHADTAKIMKAIAKKWRVVEYRKISNERAAWHCLVLAAK